MKPVVNEHMRLIEPEHEDEATLDQWAFCYGYLIKQNPAAWLYGLADVEALRRKHNRQALTLAQPMNQKAA